MSIQYAVDTVLSHESLFRVAGTLIGAVGAASAVSLAIPSIVDRIRPFARQDSIADFLPFERMLPNGRHIACAGKQYISIVRIDGADLTLSTDARRHELFALRKKLLDEAQREAFTELRFVTLKERSPIKVRNTHRNKTLAAITETWNSEFTETYQISHYAIIVVHADKDDDAAQALTQAEDFLVQGLRDYRCSVLEENRADPAAGPLAMLAKLVSPISKPTPLGRNAAPGDLGRMLCADAIDFREEEHGFFRFANGRRTLHASIVGIRDCGEKTSENVMRDILAIDGDLIIFQTIKPLDSTSQLLTLTREKMSAPMMTLSSTASDEYATAIALVEGQTQFTATLHNYALNVMAMSEDPDHLASMESDITAYIKRTGATVVREQITAPAIWFSLFPNDEIWPRSFRFMSHNIACNLPLQKPSGGLLRSEWLHDEPIAYFRSISGEAYGFSFHGSDDVRSMPAAHVAVIGPTGGGKTTLIEFLASQALRIKGLKVYLFDRHNGCEVFTRCCGGEYITFEGDTATARMNPLLMPDTHENRQWLKQWLSLLGNDDTAGAMRDISRIVDMVYGEIDPETNTLLAPPADPDQRVLSTIIRAAVLPNTQLRRNLDVWCDGSMLGGYFNAQTDSLSLANRDLFSFDMTSILENEKLAPAVISYLTHRIRTQSAQSGAPSLIFIDEAEPMLRNSRFQTLFARTGLQEGRKLRQSYVLAFQRPDAISTGNMADVIRGQCHTVIFLRNPNGKAEEYAHWNLSEPELDFVLGRSFIEHRYAVLIKKTESQRSAIVNVDLSKLGEKVKLFSSSRPDVNALRAAISAHDNNPDLFIPAYLRGDFVGAQV